MRNGPADLSRAVFVWPFPIGLDPASIRLHLSDVFFFGEAMNRIGIATCLLFCVAAANVARAQSVTTEKSTKWGPAPAFLPAGATAAVLDGDPMKSGEFTLRLN